MTSGTLRTGSVLGNPSGTEAPVVDATMSQMLNQTISATPTWTGMHTWILGSSSIKISNGTYSGYITPGAAQDGINISGGTHFNGTNWIADDPTASWLNVSTSQIQITQATGLTIGAAISWSIRALLTPAGGWQAQGTTTNDTASAGFIGESAQWNGSLTPLTSGSWAGLASIALTPGDWDIWALVQFNGGTTTQVGQLTLGFGTTATGHELGSITTPFMNQTPFAYSVVSPSYPSNRSIRLRRFSSSSPSVDFALVMSMSR